ncbi:hypothetical protein [Rickettsia endosymbiont of Polydrusus tereticollis]|uniref:hypothetical protein n=1 Tax=Rickettsia endosymbiont of Polydrusus tereticollis TaxID=3066251 RepID=UPI003132BD41|nr:hypothetical protein [Rickettsia endosymbiont of Oxypoda opaca]
MYINTLTVSSKDQILLSSSHDLSGSLADYNKNTNLSLQEIRKQVWQENTLRFSTREAIGAKNNL